MGGSTTAGDEAFAAALGQAHPRLVRFCAHLCRDPHAADDLAQDAMLVAWRRRAQLADPSGALPWLQAIARNLARNRLRSLRRAPAGEPLREEAHASADDLERALEDQELAALLGRALGALPPQARAALELHHLAGLPQAAVAERLGVAEGTLAVRLHRARQQLRGVLLADERLREEARAYGLLPAEGPGWQATSIWCPVCGAHRYLGRLAPGSAELWLRCPGCSPDPDSFCAHTAAPEVLGGVAGFRAALGRTAAWAHRFYGALAEAGAAACVSCGGAVARREPQPAGAWAFACRRCGATYDTSALGVALARPEALAFWRRHGRIRSLPTAPIDVGGRPALLARFEPAAGGRPLEIALGRERGELLAVEGA